MTNRIITDYKHYTAGPHPYASYVKAGDVLRMGWGYSVNWFKIISTNGSWGKCFVASPAEIEEAKNEDLATKIEHEINTKNDQQTPHQ